MKWTKIETQDLSSLEYTWQFLLILENLGLNYVQVQRENVQDTIDWFCSECRSHDDDCQCHFSEDYEDYDEAYDRWKDDQMEKG